MCKDLVCGALLDASCLESYERILSAKGKSMECQNCRGNSGYSKMVPPVIKNTMANFKFKCHRVGCDELYNFSDAKKHYVTCVTKPPQPPIRCLLDCSDLTEFLNEDEMR